MRAMPTPPDCEAIARPPVGGTNGLKVALSRTSGWLDISPRQLGPTSRMLCSRAVRSISRWISRPSPPSSSKPEEMTTAEDAPAVAASRMVSSTRPAGTATTTRSTCHGTSPRRGYAVTPSTASACGCTTQSRPVKPPELIEWSTAAPIPVPSRRTPVTATLPG